MAALIGMSLASYVWMVSNAAIAATRSLAWNGAIPILEAGAEEALTQLEYNDINHLAANKWKDLGNGWFCKSRNVDQTSYYEVMIKQVEPPIIVTTGYVPAPLAPSAPFGMVPGSIVPATSPNPGLYVKRRVRMDTARKPIFPCAMLAKGRIDLAGNHVTTDGFDSSDPLYSTLGKYDRTRIKASGDVQTNSRDKNAINVGNADIMGRAGNGAGGTVKVGSQGSVGDLNWAKGGNHDIEKGWISEDVNIQIDDVEVPFTAGYTTPISGRVGANSYTYVLNGAENEYYKLSQFGGNVYVIGNVILLVTDKFEFAANDYIYIAPGGTLKVYVAAPTAKIGGRGIINSDGYAANFQYYGLPTNKELNVGGNAAFTGAIYAPEASFTISGGGNNDYDFVGACVVSRVRLAGHVHFHFDEALRKTYWKGYVVTAWNELDPNAAVE